MTKIFNFALKIKGGGREGGRCEVLRPAIPPKFGTCTMFRDKIFEPIPSDSLGQNC